MSNNLKPRKPFEVALKDFLDMAKDQPQNRIIRYFLEQIVTHSDICDQGSVLIYDSTTRQLRTYDKSNNSHSLAKWPKDEVTFENDTGLAWLAFRKRTPLFTKCAKQHPEFESLPDSDIGSMYCLPVFRKNDLTPFSIISFHNPDGKEVIRDDARTKMEIAVSVLESQLALSQTPLVASEKVFIVHGHDDRFRNELESILQNKVEYVVIQALARTGQDLLSFLEEKIRDCVAGFVLLTPDDEGRLYKFAEPLRQRARQNVIFEGGYLTALFRGKNRICFLQKGDIEVPSDLNGLLMERFPERIDPERILLTLEEWGLGSTPSESEGGARHQKAQGLQSIAAQ